ncbi:MAG TPA: hypothetical protein VGS03_09300 [Candidatus Polarisedimenticolia bacterium]|jgi:ribosomal protein S1|nr:hypothetical protein [Candidatus Polarisedimenticolia bacterium]
MKTLVRLCTVLAIVAMVAAPMSSAFAGGAKKTHDVQVTVVSVNADGKTMTIKGPDGAEKTVPVTGQAINKIKSVQPGQTVTVVCTDNEKGEHESISDIKMEKASSK